jgi:hypothetical protein
MTMDRRTTGPPSRTSRRAVPEIDPTLPVAPADDRVEASPTRARESLERVPESVSASQVPDGVGARRIDSRRAVAAEIPASVIEPAASLEGLSRGRVALGVAAGAETMDAVAVGDRTPAAVLARGESVGDEVDAVAAVYGYPGTDRVEKLVTVGTAERYLSTARRTFSSTIGRSHDADVMAAADSGGRIETALAYAGDASHIPKQFAEALEDPSDFEAGRDSSPCRLTSSSAAGRTTHPLVPPRLRWSRRQ